MSQIFFRMHPRLATVFYFLLIFEGEMVQEMIFSISGQTGRGVGIRWYSRHVEAMECWVWYAAPINDAWCTIIHWFGMWCHSGKKRKNAKANLIFDSKHSPERSDQRGCDLLTWRKWSQSTENFDSRWCYARRTWPATTHRIRMFSFGCEFDKSLPNDLRAGLWPGRATNETFTAFVAALVHTICIALENWRIFVVSTGSWSVRIARSTRYLFRCK